MILVRIKTYSVLAGARTGEGAVGRDGKDEQESREVNSLLYHECKASMYACVEASGVSFLRPRSSLLFVVVSVVVIRQ